MLLTTTVAFIAIIAKKSTKVVGHGEDNGDEEETQASRPYCLPNLARKSLLVLGWAFCCGVFLVLWYMINFSLWIAGTYLSVITIQKLRQPEVWGISNEGCPISVVGLASSSAIIVWTVFFAVCCRIVYRPVFYTLTQVIDRFSGFGFDNLLLWINTQTFCCDKRNIEMNGGQKNKLVIVGYVTTACGGSRPQLQDRTVAKTRPWKCLAEETVSEDTGPLVGRTGCLKQEIAQNH